MPSCSEVVTHFYGQGCAFYNDDGPVSMSDFISDCRQMTSALPSYKNCEDELKDFLNCLGDANDSECTSCNDELDKLFYCG